MDKTTAQLIIKLLKQGHGQNCRSRVVVRVERTGDTNDVDVFGRCDCGLHAIFRFIKKHFPYDC